MMVSNSMRVNRPRPPWRRRRWQVRLIQVTMAIRSSSRVALSGAALGDVGQPQLVGRLGGEPVSRHAVPVEVGAQVVVDRWAGFLSCLPRLGLPDARRAGTSSSRQVGLREVRSCPPQDLVLLLQQPDPLLSLTQLGGGGRGRAGLDPALDVGGPQPGTTSWSPLAVGRMRRASRHEVPGFEPGR